MAAMHEDDTPDFREVAKILRDTLEVELFLHLLCSCILNWHVWLSLAPIFHPLFHILPFIFSTIIIFNHTYFIKIKLHAN